MSAPDFEQRVRTILDELYKLRNRTLPVKVGEAALAKVRDNFRKGGIDGTKWKEPYRRKLSFNGAAGKYGPLLSETSTLMAANEYVARPGKVLLKNEKPYAIIQNDGGTIRVTAKMKKYFWYRYKQVTGSMTRTKKGKVGNNQYNRTLNREAEFWKGMALKRVNSVIRMPARKFLGQSRELNDVVNKTIADELTAFVLKYGKSSGTPR